MSFRISDTEQQNNRIQKRQKKKNISATLPPWLAIGHIANLKFKILQCNM